MICNRLDNGWELVYQRAHALLAAMVVQAWRVNERPERWFETLNAIAQHDNGWQEWESGTRLNAKGEPLHFRDTPADDAITQGARAIIRAHHQDLYAGLLVSRHISELHESRRGLNPALTALLDEQAELRKRWRAATGTSQEDEDHAYAFLKWGDEMSLLLCCRSLHDGRPHQVWRVAGTDYQATALDTETIRIQPWPYECEVVDVGIDVFRLQQHRFAGPDELAHLLMNTPPVRKQWRLVPPA